MDNFMDKLAKRFSAGELIKANGAAEERELNMAKEQALENEKLLQEIRRLNLKNVELSEQVGQLIQCGIEQFEEYDKAAEKATEKTESSYEEYVNAIKEELKKTEEELKKTGEGLKKAEEEQKARLNSIENAMKSLSDKLQGAGSDEALSGEVKKLQDIIIEEMKKLQESLAEEIKKQQETTRALEEYVHKENVKVYRNVQAVVVDQASQKTRELGDRLDALERNTKKGSGLLPLVVMTFLVAAVSLVLQLAQILQIL